MTITTAQVATPRLDFFYRKHGTEDGLPMLLVHGSYGSSRWWEPLMELLPEEILAIAPDLRGVGGSDHTDSGYAIDEQAADLAALLDALDWHDFDLVAHSSGGAIAMEYVLRNPDRVRSLTLVDSVPLEGVFTPLDTYVLLQQMQTDRDLLAQALHALMPSLDLSGGDPAVLRFFWQLVDDAQRMAPAAFTAIADALNAWNRFGEGNNLRLPTLLLWGEHDVIIEREAMTRTLIAIPGANNLDVMRGVGHAPMIEAPAALAERITDFIVEDFADFEDVRRLATEDDTDDDATPNETGEVSG